MAADFCVLITNGYGKELYRSNPIKDVQEAMTKARNFNKQQMTVHNARQAYVEVLLYVKNVPVQEF